MNFYIEIYFTTDDNTINYNEIVSPIVSEYKSFVAKCIAAISCVNTEDATCIGDFLNNHCIYITNKVIFSFNVFVKNLQESCTLERLVINDNIFYNFQDGWEYISQNL